MAERPALPVEYRDAKRALAAVARIDVAKDFRDKAIAIEVYAMQAKDAELVAPAVTMRKHAERRIGQIILDESKAGKLAKGARERGTKRGTTRVDEKPASLADRGVDKNLADRSRKAAAMPEDKFEAHVAQTIKITVAAIESNDAVIRAARDERHKRKTAQRATRERTLATKIQALPQKRYGVIVADPEWKFEGWSDRGLDASSAVNHYPVSDLDTIKARGVPSIAASDCVLFLWATQPMLPHALETMRAWGFEYKSHCVWNKNRTGTAYWFANKHEILLVGTRGNIPAPAEGTQWPSVIDAPRGEHSAKPELFLEMIESYFPTLPKIELNRRGPARAGWDAWGNEAETSEAAA